MSLLLLSLVGAALAAPYANFSSGNALLSTPGVIVAGELQGIHLHVVNYSIIASRWTQWLAG